MEINHDIVCIKFEGHVRAFTDQGQFIARQLIHLVGSCAVRSRNLNFVPERIRIANCPDDELMVGKLTVGSGDIDQDITRVNQQIHRVAYFCIMQPDSIRFVWTHRTELQPGVRFDEEHSGLDLAYHPTETIVCSLQDDLLWLSTYRCCDKNRRQADEPCSTMFWHSHLLLISRNNGRHQYPASPKPTGPPETAIPYS